MAPTASRFLTKSSHGGEVDSISPQAVRMPSAARRAGRQGIRSGLWRLNIAADHQGCGYGRFAVESVCEEARRRGLSRVTTTWAPGEHGPERFYLRLGFRPTGEKCGNQVVGELDLVEAG